MLHVLLKERDNAYLKLLQTALFHACGMCGPRSSRAPRGGTWISGAAPSTHMRMLECCAVHATQGTLKLPYRVLRELMMALRGLDTRLASCGQAPTGRIRRRRHVLYWTARNVAVYRRAFGGGGMEDASATWWKEGGVCKSSCERTQSHAAPCRGPVSAAWAPLQQAPVPTWACLQKKGQPIPSGRGGCHRVMRVLLGHGTACKS